MLNTLVTLYFEACMMQACITQQVKQLPEEEQKEFTKLFAKMSKDVQKNSSIIQKSQKKSKKD